jgi:hypothetical protein
VTAETLAAAHQPVKRMRRPSGTDEEGNRYSYGEPHATGQECRVCRLVWPCDVSLFLAALPVSPTDGLAYRSGYSDGLNAALGQMTIVNPDASTDLAEEIAAEYARLEVTRESE